MYQANDAEITVNLNATICGDFTITLYHARNVLKGMGRPQGIKVCQFQMHSGFLPEEETLISFDKSELDDLPEENIPKNFNVSVAISVNNVERAPANCPWIPLKAQRNPIILFSTQHEYDETVDNFSKFFYYFSERMFKFKINDFE